MGCGASQEQIHALPIPITIRKLAGENEENTDIMTEMMTLVPVHVAKVKQFRKQCGKKEVCKVDVDMVYGGMRGIVALVTETSHLHPEKGISFRGYTVQQVRELLPRMEGCQEPMAEGMFWLLLTGKIPSLQQVSCLSRTLDRRSKLPIHVRNVLNAMPSSLHPMTQFACAIAAAGQDSVFANAYRTGVQKATYWEYVLEDSLTLLAQLPAIAATIYSNMFHKRSYIDETSPDLDWAGNFACQLGFSRSNKQIAEFLRLYLIIHCDHEGGNVSAHTTHLVGSALADPFAALSAGMQGLYGPLHGRATQDVLEWIQKMMDELGPDVTDDEKINEFIWNTLNNGQVVPGYGHAVLRGTDPRFTVQREFALRNCPDSPQVRLVHRLFELVPPILTKLGKVANPWPNVDAHSGVLLHHFGLEEMSFYTVLFGVSRALGVLASLVWDRALGLPIERPKSITSEALMQRVGYPDATDEDASKPS